MKVIELMCNQMLNPIGIGDQDISFSWKLSSEKRNIKQKRYDLQVALDSDFKGVIWHQNEWSDQSANLPYKGTKLVSKTRYYARVKCMDMDGSETEWSPVCSFESGLLEAEEWQAEWITPQKRENDNEGKFRKPFTAKYKFQCSKKVQKARLYVSALGIYSADLNGEKIGKDYLTPGWTDYNDRVQYQTYDITNQLAQKNEIAVTVAEGWFSGFLGWEKKKDTYGNFNAFIGQIEIEYTDGSTEIIGSNEDWREVSSRWLMADLYNGEVQDNTIEKKALSKMKALNLSKKTLVPQENEPVRKQEKIQPLDLFRDSKGRLILDMGQNMVGWVKFNAKGEKGQKISLTHGEILDRDGNFYRDNIREAQQRDSFILTGNAETLEPNFTFHGFRYVHLENFPENVKKEDFCGVVLHSDMKKSGSFETSDPLINQLHHNIVWGQKGNFLDVPTDCPQRDERLGWTADAQIFFPTASFNMNVINFFKKWLKDLSYSQAEDGSVPFVVPDILKGVFADNAARTTAAWGDAAAIVPWEMYQRFGLKSVLKESYSMMKKWVDYVRGQGQEEYLWDTGLQLGDWLALDAEEGSFFGATDEVLVAACYFAYSANIVAETAKILGYYQDYKEYRYLFEKIKEKIAQTYFDRDGYLLSDTQTAYIIVLMFKVYPRPLEKQLVTRLVSLIEKKKQHLDTGFIGSPYICRVLVDHGQTDLAYQLLFNKDLPSWLYQVEKGATTVWEHWDGIKSDGTFWEDGMNSFNHYAYGSIGIWMYETIGGLRVKKPGYQQAIIAPKITERLNYCKTSLMTLYGELSSHWAIEGDQINLTVNIPANAEAEVVLPDVANKDYVLNIVEKEWTPKRIGRSQGEEITDIGIAKFKEHQEITDEAALDENELLVFLGSGEYQISYKLAK